MNVRLNVTNKNINEAKQADPTNCPIARALKRTVRGIKNVRVYGKNANMLVKKGKKITFYTTVLENAATTFIKRFDSGLAVHPFKLKITWKRAATPVTMF